MSLNNIEIIVDETHVEVVESTPSSVTVTTPGSTSVLVATGGIQGSPGNPNTLSMGSVVTGMPGSSAAASIIGISPNQTLNLTIPRGDTGLTGSAATIAVGTTTTGTAGSNATVTNTGTSAAAIFNFTIPRGNTGATGPAPNLAIGTVSTVAVGGNATATVTGTNPNYILNIGIPTGATGATGPAPTLSSVIVTTGTPGSSATGSWSGTNPYTLNLTVPRGDVGPTGFTGPAPTLNTPTVTALSVGASPTVGITGTNPYTINFGIPAAATWFNGTAPPATGTGIIGDFYLVSAGSGLGDVYKKTASATWTLQGNIRGAAGTGSLSTSGAAVTGNLTKFTDTSGTLIDNAGFAASDVMLLSTLQTVTGSKTFTNGQTTFSGVSPTVSLTHTNSVATGLVLSNTTTVGGASPRLFFQNDTNANVIYRTANGLALTYGANPGTTSGSTILLHLADNGASIFSGSVAAGGTGFSGAGANITTLNASNLSTGTVADTRLTTNVALLTGTQTFTGLKTFTAPVVQSSLTLNDASSVAQAYIAVATSVGAFAATSAIGDAVIRAQNNMIFSINTAERMRINSAGLVTMTNGLTVTGTATATTFSGSGASLTSIPAAQLTGAATLPNGVLPTRLGTYAATITDWDTAVTNGWYMASGATNNPTANATWYIGEVLAHNALWITQTVHAFTLDTSSNTQVYRRSFNNGVWEAWYKLQLSQTEQDARYATIGHNHDSVYMNLTTSQTIAGIKTFSNRMSLAQGLTFGGSGAAAPTFTTYSGGVKVILFDSISSTGAGFTLGIDAGTMWSGVNTTGDSFKWYGGTTLAATLTGTGALTTIGSVTATSFVGSGASLTALNGSNVSTGTVADARLSTNVALLTGNQTFSGAKTFSAPITVQSGVVFKDAGFGDKGFIGVALSAGSYASAAAIGDTYIRSIESLHLAVNTGTTGLSIAKTTGLVTIPNGLTVTGTVTVPDSSWTISKTSGLQAALDLKAPLAGPTFTGTTTTAALTVNGFRDQLHPGSLAGTVDSYVILNTDRIAGNTNNFQAIRMVRRNSATLTDWTTTELIDGVGVDSSFITPATIRSYIRRNPMNQAIAFGSTNDDYMTLTPTVVTITKPISGTSTITAAGTGFAGPGVNITTLNATNLSTGTVPQARTAPNIQVFNYTTGSEARPTGTTYVMWRGPAAVTPVNAIDGDSWEKVN